VKDPPTDGRKKAEAELEPSELQDVVDELDSIIKAGVGVGLTFHLRIELPDGDLDPDQLMGINNALAKACAKLKFDQGES
jgi:hypothetical protein